MSVKVRPYRRGGWEADIRVTLPDGRDCGCARRRPARQVCRDAVGWGRERDLLLGRRSGEEGESDTRRVCAAVPRGYARANRQKPSGSPARRRSSGCTSRRDWHEAAGRHHERGRAAAEGPPGGQGAEDGQQRADGVEHAVASRGGVGRDRAGTLHDPSAADAEDAALSTTSRSTNGLSKLQGTMRGPSHRASGRGCRTPSGEIMALRKDMIS